jgi:hypothetical protein
MQPMKLNNKYYNDRPNAPLANAPLDNNSNQASAPPL